jgi:PQQ enzyme repeat
MHSTAFDQPKANSMLLGFICSVPFVPSVPVVVSTVLSLSYLVMHPPVFSGTVDRNIHAFEAVSGKILWEFTTNSGIIAPPTTFTVDGKKYLAVQSGWEGDARAMTNAVRPFFPGEVPNVRRAAPSGCSR